MPGKRHKSITINDKVISKMGLTAQKVSYNLEKYLEEKETLGKFALKITKMPETVHVYTPFTTKGEGGIV